MHQNIVYDVVQVSKSSATSKAEALAYAVKKQQKKHEGNGRDP